MTWLRRGAIVFLSLVFLVSFTGIFAVRTPYHMQFREHANAKPDSRFLLGCDELGRDRFARLLYGTRVSLLLAPAAALLSTLIAAAIGLLAGYLGGWVERLAMLATDLSLSLPWLFLLLFVRALLPLNVSAWVSVAITFLLLGLLGWGSAARVVRAAVLKWKRADHSLLALAMGYSNHRVMLIQILPRLKPVLAAQFWLAVPLYILSEANLGMLGLGVTEPLPSWGNLLAELQNFHGLLGTPWRLAPAILLVLVLASFSVVLTKDEVIR